MAAVTALEEWAKMAMKLLVVVAAAEASENAALAMRQDSSRTSLQSFFLQNLKKLFLEIFEIEKIFVELPLLGELPFRFFIHFSATKSGADLYFSRMGIFKTVS